MPHGDCVRAIEMLAGTRMVTVRWLSSENKLAKNITRQPVRAVHTFPTGHLFRAKHCTVRSRGGPKTSQKLRVHPLSVVVCECVCFFFFRCVWRKSGPCLASADQAELSSCTRSSNKPIACSLGPSSFGVGRNRLTYRCSNHTPSTDSTTLH